MGQWFSQADRRGGRGQELRLRQLTDWTGRSVLCPVGREGMASGFTCVNCRLGKL